MLYDYPWDFLLRRFKFGGELSLGRTLAGVMVAHAPPDWTEIDALVPVPLHHSRLRERGYDQARELAQQLHRLTRVPLATGVLTRVRPTSPQVGLDAQQRRGNVRGAFIVSGAVPQRVCLVDDVMTTGATVSACATVLKRAGAEKVSVWCAARAER